MQYQYYITPIFFNGVNDYIFDISNMLSKTVAISNDINHTIDYVKSYLKNLDISITRKISMISEDKQN